MAQQPRALVILPEDLDLFPSTHIRQLTTASESSFMVSDVLFWIHTHKKFKILERKYREEVIRHWLGQ